MSETPEHPVIHAEAAFQVAAEAGTRLEQLHAAYADAKAKSDAAASELKAITDGIKLELSTAAPESRKIELVGAAGPPLRLTYTESWRLDSKKLKADDPETYVRYAVQSGSWTLKPAKAGESE